MLKHYLLYVQSVCPFSEHVNVPEALIVPSHVSTRLPGDHTWNLAYIAAPRINIATANMQTSLCHLHSVLCLPIYLSKASGKSMNQLMTGWDMHQKKSLGFSSNQADNVSVFHLYKNTEIFHTSRFILTLSVLKQHRRGFYPNI